MAEVDTPAFGTWLPIETAPKDGTLVILAVPVVHGIGWCIGEAGFNSYSDEPGWWWANTSPGDYTFDPIEHMNGNPTHWMPLPPPPGEK